MRFVICYDITENARRERVASTLLDYGRRIQESVFVATLDEELHAKMLDRLKRLVDEAVDTIHVFALCSACDKRIERMGRAELPEDRPYYIV